MSTEALFEQLTIEGPKVRITFNDAPYEVPDGMNLAAALLAVGVRRFRSTPVSGSPRAPYCMMGVCFECLVEIDGSPNCQSCLESARDGMVIRSQEGARQVMFQSSAESASTIGGKG
ncbi:(2Fe-2S)-binding protein [Paraburkholderia sp. MM5477-R1]|uniref:(2Fe-2S)-binding protein n=1 Tax=Paraburkholderia sp. MM5477-R1 TaxID=2991062 RepID=UPI003D208714